MRRRAVLATLTGSMSAIAGCGTLDGRETSRPTFGVDRRTTDPNDVDAYDDGPPNEPAATVTTPGFERRATLFDVSVDAPDLSYTVGLLGRDDGGPLRIWVDVTNERDTERELTFDGAVPFGAPVGVSLATTGDGFEVDPAGPRLWLVPAADPSYRSVRPVETRADCWRASGPVDGTGVARSVTLSGGETAGQAFELLTPPGTDGCLPHGRYRFETPDGRLGFSLSLWNPPVGPPTAELDGITLPAIEAETTWFHDANDTVAPVYLRPATESFEAGRTVGFTLHNHGTEPVRTIGPQLFRSNGTAWLPVVETDPTLPRNQALVPPGGTTVVEVGFGGHATDLSLRELRAGHYALRLRLDGVGADPGAVVAVTDGTDPALSTTTQFREVSRSDGVVTLEPDRGDADEPVAELERGGPAEATAIPLERVLRYETLRNALASLLADDSARAVRLRTDSDEALRAAENVRELDGPDDAFRFRGQVYTFRVTS